MPRSLALCMVLLASARGRTTPRGLTPIIEALPGSNLFCGDGNTKDGDGCSGTCRALK